MDKPDFTGIKAVLVNCTLKRSPDTSHTRGLMDLAAGIMKREGVQIDFIRMADHDVATGIYPDMTAHGWSTDEWPELFQKIIAADILVIGSPIWLGQISSEARKFIERLYSNSAELNPRGQFVYYGKTAGCIITGNEDGVKHCASDILYSLQHIGYVVPPQADCGWVGDVGPGPSYLDNDSGAADNDFTNRNTTFMTYNLLHTAAMLRKNGGFPAYGNVAEQWDSGQRWAFEKRNS